MSALSRRLHFSFRPVFCLGLAAAVVGVFGGGSPARADRNTLSEARALYSKGLYFRAARYAFAAKEMESGLEGPASALITSSLMRAGLHNAASYFFVRTLQSKNREAIRKVLVETEELMSIVGSDLIRKYLVQNASIEDFSGGDRSAFLYSVGKEALLVGKYEEAIRNLSGIGQRSSLYAQALQLRGTAYVIQGAVLRGIEDFEGCRDWASKSVERFEATLSQGHLKSVVRAKQQEADDLRNRCRAGIGRAYYQLNQFDNAEEAYDRIPKSSFVWTEILFEQAWNAYAKREYNRTLGKLVTYKSPALEFYYNSEVEVLNAQAYLALCLYPDAAKAITEFAEKYTDLGKEVKRTVEDNASNLNAFYVMGKKALSRSIYTKSEFEKMVNRFVRGPYFQRLVHNEEALKGEIAAARQFGAHQKQIERDLGLSSGRGLGAFLEQVLLWRLKTIRTLGGAFVKNSLIDYHGALVSNFEKISFIRLDMLRNAREALIYKNQKKTRDRGNVEPSRRSNQYYWSFNGEFWNDELGDYVFGLESQCSKPTQQSALRKSTPAAG